MNVSDLTYESNPKQAILSSTAAVKSSSIFTWEILSLVTSADGEVVLDLTDGTTECMNWQVQSGVGTDIKYSKFALGKRHIVYMKTFAPESPIVSQLKGKLGQKVKVAWS